MRKLQLKALLSRLSPKADRPFTFDFFKRRVFPAAFVLRPGNFSAMIVHVLRDREPCTISVMNKGLADFGRPLTAV
jgi:hypothetical protein